MGAEMHARGSGNDGERSRVRLSGVVPVPVHVSDALRLFTPTGEKAWAPGWDPRFPVPTEDDSEPGTVFEVVHGDVQSVWMVCRSEPGRLIQYARVFPGRTAGTITVTLVAAPAGSVATVDYDLTALTAEGAEEIAELADGYEAYLAGWARAIAESCR
jgi:hypothetical protein